MKKSNFKKALSLIMAVVMFAIPLSACGKDKPKNGEAELSEYVFVPTYTSIDKNVKEMNSVYCAGDRIYFTANVPVHADGTPATDEEVKEMDDYYASANGPAGEYTSTNITSTASGTETVVSTTREATAEAAPAPDGTAPAEEKTFDISYQTGLFSIKTDGTDYTALTDYKVPQKPDNENSYAGLDRMIADAQGNIWVAESVTTTLYNLPADFDPAKQNMWDYYAGEERQNFIRKLTSTGAEVSTLDLTQFVEKSTDATDEFRNQFYINDMSMDASGNLYISDGNNTVYVIGSDGSFQFKLSVDTWLNRFVKLKDGSVCASTNNESGEMILKVIDFNAKAWGKDVKMPANAWNTSSGGDAYDFCYTDGSSLFGYSMATETPEKILNWLNCDIDSNNIQYSTVLDDGNVFAITSDYRSEKGPSYEIVTLVKTPRSEVKQKTTLTMATMWLDYNLRKQLLSFNKTNPDYRIEIMDYSEYNTQEDWTAGVTKLNTEIISGNVPDIINISSLPYQQYAAKGLLEDLYPFIDKDPDVAKEDFVKSIISAVETDGKLFQLISSFGVMSIVGSPSVVGEEMGWTMDEMQAVIAEHPEADLPFGQHKSRENILQMLCMLNMENYMNWQTGECSFNSDDFKKLLTFASTFPSQEELEKASQEGDWIDPGTLISEGRQLFDMFNASDFQNYQYYKAMFGGKVSFKGFPTEKKNGNVASFDGGLAMTTSCKDKEGAWQFMRTLLLEDYQDNLDWNYPIIQKSFDKKLAEAMKQEYTTDENGNKVPVSHGGMSMGNGPTIEFYAITQEEADQIKALIDSVENTVVYDESITNIISEEAALFFAGQKTVDQTADIIQSRMNIYINEQR